MSTNIVLFSAMYVGPLVYLAGSKDFAGYVELIKSWGTVGTGLVGATKFSLAFCFSYHLWASVRHLVGCFVSNADSAVSHLL